MSFAFSHYGILLLAVLFAFLMAWGIGANDVANAMGTSVGSGAITLKQALLVAAVFEFCGAFFAGGQVTTTIQSGLINSQTIPENHHLLMLGMLSALLSSSIWLLMASYYGWPVSTTHAIVGSIVGFAIVSIGPEAVQWHAITRIVMSWIVSPLIAGFIAFLLFMSVQRVILNAVSPFTAAKRYGPCYLWLTGFVLSMVTLVKGLKHFHLNISYFGSMGFSVCMGVLLALVGFLVLHRLPALKDDVSRHEQFRQVEKVFALLMLFTACSMAFAHGSNDVANAIGPLAAIFSLSKGAHLIHQATVPAWALLLGGVGIVLGLAMYGYRVIATIGQHITELTPSRGFVAELATATTVVIASGTGLPISTTQTLVGAVLGVGFARGIAALNLQVIRGIFLSWVITLPVSAGLAVLVLTLLKRIFA